MTGQKPIQVIKAFSSSLYSAGKSSSSIVRRHLFCCSSLKLPGCALTWGCPLVMRCWIKIIRFLRPDMELCTTDPELAQQQININCRRWQIQAMLDRLARSWELQCVTLESGYLMLYLFTVWENSTIQSIESAKLAISSCYCTQWCTHRYHRTSMHLSLSPHVELPRPSVSI